MINNSTTHPLSSFYKNKKVFITGHTGFKGSWLCLWLHSLGAKVIGYALNPPTDPNLFELCSIDRLVQSTIADVRDGVSLTNAMLVAKPDIVIHMAAQPLVRDSYKIPVETYATNVMGTVNLFEATRHCKTVKAVINVTTDKCYENKEWVWGYSESEPLGGYDPYSNSEPIAFAHIDCDWYRSVKCCIERVVDMVVPDGLIIFDDYNSFSGAKRAVDEWLTNETRYESLDDRWSLVVRRKRELT